MARRSRPRRCAGVRRYCGIGIDLVDLAEFSEIMARYPQWLSHVFTRRELAYCRQRPRPMQHFAARFAAKEAAFKAIGTGWSSGVGWHDAELVSVPGKAPSLITRGELARRARALGATEFHVSVSHSGGYAAAVVMLVCRAWCRSALPCVPPTTREKTR